MGETPLVLLPGMLCDAALWEHQAANLSDVAEVSVGDLTRDDSIASMARSVLAASPERFALAGFSLGGIVAFEILRREPRRVERLALLDTSARPPREDQLRAWREFAAMTESGRFREVVEERLLPVSVHPARREDEKLAAAFVGMARNVGEEGFLRQLAAQASRPDSRETLREIRCPTLVAGGRQDGLCPLEVLGEIHSSVPGASFEVVEDCGHMSPMERPEEITAVLRGWLETGTKETLERA